MLLLIELFLYQLFDLGIHRRWSHICRVVIRDVYDSISVIRSIVGVSLPVPRYVSFGALIVGSHVRKTSEELLVLSEQLFILVKAMIHSFFINVAAVFNFFSIFSFIIQFENVMTFLFEFAFNLEIDVF